MAEGVAVEKDSYSGGGGAGGMVCWEAWESIGGGVKEAVRGIPLFDMVEMLNPQFGQNLIVSEESEIPHSGQNFIFPN